jgi:hypothetical protein
MLVFSTQLCDQGYPPLLPLSPSLWFNSPPFISLHCVNKYTVYSIQFLRGVKGMDGVLGLRQTNIYRKVSLQVNFLDDDILH